MCVPVCVRVSLGVMFPVTRRWWMSSRVPAGGSTVRALAEGGGPVWVNYARSCAWRGGGAPGRTRCKWGT